MNNDDGGPGGPKVSDQIDANLKRVYREIVGDDVPDRFRQLLDQLRSQDAGAGDPPAAGEGKDAPAPRATGRGMA